MSYIYIVCLTLIGFFSFSIVTKRKKTLSEKIFVGWIFLLAITEYSFFVNAIDKTENYILLFSIICDTHVLHGAFYYLYVQSFTNSNFKLKLKHLVHIVPFISIAGLKIYFNNVLGVLDCYGLGCIHSGNRYVDLLTFLKFAILGGYLFYGWLTIHEKVNHGNTQDKLQSIRFNWLKNITVGIFIIFFIAVTYNVINRLQFDFLGSPMTVINIMVTFFILIFLYLGNTYAYLFVTPYNTPSINLDIKPNIPAPTNSELPQESISNIQEKFDQIEDYLRTHKPYLEGQMTIKQLSDQINIPQNEISIIIQQKTDKYYCDYMNAYRVEALKEKLSDVKYNNYTVLSLALECGFASKTSLNRIFKQHTGVTPSEFKAQTPQYNK